MFENCTEIRALFAGYLDGGSGRDQVKSVRFHLNYCDACRRELEMAQAIQSDLRALRRRRMPAELSLALRVHLSQLLHDDWVTRWRIRLENSLKPLLLPAAGGVIIAMICFGCLLGSNPLPLLSGQRPDVPLALVTPPRLLELPPIDFNTDDDQLVVMTQVSAAGQVMSYEVVSGGSISPEVRYHLDRLIYFSVFEPATTFGTPTDGKVLLALSRITVRG
jgi:hypothetical protein